MHYSEKQVYDKITRTTEAWEEHAEAIKFAEMTLDEFKAKMKPSLDCREKIASLRRQLEAAIKKRQECDVASIDVCAKVVNNGGKLTTYRARRVHYAWGLARAFRERPPRGHPATLPVDGNRGERSRDGEWLTSHCAMASATARVKLRGSMAGNR